MLDPQEASVWLLDVKEASWFLKKATGCKNTDLVTNDAIQLRPIALSLGFRKAASLPANQMRQGIKPVRRA
jgi:hypothetical protein